jgi:hypothetical protein
LGAVSGSIFGPVPGAVGCARLGPFRAAPVGLFGVAPWGALVAAVGGAWPPLAGCSREAQAACRSRSTTSATGERTACRRCPRLALPLRAAGACLRGGMGCRRTGWPGLDPAAPGGAGLVIALALYTGENFSRVFFAGAQARTYKLMPCPIGNLRPIHPLASERFRFWAIGAPWDSTPLDVLECPFPG